MNVVVGHITTKIKVKIKQVIDVVRGNYNDGVCEGNAEKQCCEGEWMF